MARSDSGKTRGRFSPIPAAFSVMVWMSAVIVMGILAYLVSLNNNQGSHVIYELVIAIFTVAFGLASFFLKTGHALMFNLIFSYLWIVAVAFTASDWTYSRNALLHAVESFCFVAFFFSFFNVCYHWHAGHEGLRKNKTTATV